MTQNISLIVIGGSDPSGGAGVQADLFTLSELGIRAQSVITAITAQNEGKFVSYESVSPQNFADQLGSLKQDNQILFVKIGMIGDHRLLPPLMSWLEKVEPNFTILDPVLRSSTGAALLDAQGSSALQDLFKLIDLLTPNIPEAEALTGLKIKSLKEMQKAGGILLSKGISQVLMKGGHLNEEPCDILMDEEMDYLFKGSRIRSQNTHGTGCTLASAILGYMSQGHELVAAIHLARDKVREKLKSKP